MIKFINRFLLVSIFPLFFGILYNEKEQTKSTFTSIKSEIPVYNFDSLETLLYTDSEKIHVVNFWAMWCAPCVKELPFLEEYQNKNPNVSVLLVSLDFPEEIETKLKPFLKKKNISSKVVLLDDPNSNSWIDSINPRWSGTIPYTIIFNNKHRSFYERGFESLQDLENEINKTIKQ